jgi:hypothetical protein
VTAWDSYNYAGEYEKSAEQRAKAKEVIMRLVDSFEPGEPLRESLLTASPVRRIFEQGVST